VSLTPPVLAGGDHDRVTALCCPAAARFCGALGAVSPNNVQTHCKLCPVQQLAARVGLKKCPPDAHGEANLNLGTSQSVAAPAELSAPAESRQGVTATKTSDSADERARPFAQIDAASPPNQQFQGVSG